MKWSPRRKSYLRTEGQSRLPTELDELIACLAAAALREHPLREISCDDVCTARSERCRGGTGACRKIEQTHAGVRRNRFRRHVAPIAVTAERQNIVNEVILRGDVIEHSGDVCGGLSRGIWASHPTMLARSTDMNSHIVTLLQRATIFPSRPR